MIYNEFSFSLKQIIPTFYNVTLSPKCVRNSPWRALFLLMCEDVTVYSRGKAFFDKLLREKKKGSRFAFLVKTLSWDRKQE